MLSSMDIQCLAGLGPHTEHLREVGDNVWEQDNGNMGLYGVSASPLLHGRRGQSMPAD